MRKVKLALVLVLIFSSLILPSTVLAIDIASGFTLDKYKIELPTYPGAKKSVEITINNTTNTPSTYLINLRVPDILTDEEKSEGYIPVDVLQYEWFSYQKEVTAQGNGSVTINLILVVPNNTKLTKIDAWLDVQEVDASNVKMDWATTILLDIYPNKQAASKHQVVYQGQNGQLVGQREIQSKKGFNLYYLFLLLVIPAVTLPIIYLSRRYEMKLILLKVVLEKTRFPVKVIILDSDSNEPIKNASVKIGVSVATTDEKGVALLKDVQKGTQNYKVELPGFEAKSGSVEVGKDLLVEEE